jgi:hypothetical protein
MEVDQFSLITGILFLIIIFLPLFYINRKIKERRGKVLKALKGIETNAGFKFKDFEIWQDKALGVDVEKSVMVFLNLDPAREMRKFVELAKVRDFRIIQGMDVIELVFDKRMGALEMSESICIYDSSIDSPMEVGFHRILGLRWIDKLKQAKTLNPKQPKKAA